MKELEEGEDAAIYICGSMAMGQAIVDLLARSFEAEKVKAMSEGGRIVKELW